MKKTHFTAMLLLALSMSANAMTDDEYVQAVGKEVKKGAFAMSVAFGTLTNEVQVKGNKAVLSKTSKNPEFDAEILRAANAVLDGTVASGLVFPVTYKGPQHWNTDGFDRKFSRGGDASE